MVSLTVERAMSVAFTLLEAMGVSRADAIVVCNSMEYADTRGKTTHGIARLPLYYKNIKAGTMNPKAEMEVVSDKASIAVIDAHDGFGQVAAAKAVEVGIGKAHETGVAAIAVRNSNNFGTAGFFGKICADQGMIALIMANCSPAFAPTGGATPLIGTNPICFAAPGAGDKEPVVFDMAITNAARSKIRLALKNGESIPEDWAVDANGEPTTDPAVALAGSLLPLGGYKGYGLGLMVDIMAGMLAGSAFAGKVKPLSDLSGPSKNGHFFVVIDPSAFMDMVEYETAFKELTECVHASGEGAILPGERSAKIAAERAGVIALSDAQYTEIESLAKKLGRDFGNMLEGF